MKSKRNESSETIQQTREDYNAIPQIKVQDSFIKEIIIEKNLISRCDLKGNLPIYRIKISVLDDIGGRHEVTKIRGFCIDKMVIRI